MSLDQLLALGFDLSAPSSGRNYSVRCSQCAALVINGMPAHETGCPHAMHECHGCNTLVPVRVRYCEDCQS